MAQVNDTLLDLLKQDLSPKTIAQRLGLNEVAARRVIQSLVKEHNLSYKGSVSDDRPYGFTDASVGFRIYLANLLYDLRERLDGDRKAVSSLVGLNRSEQIRAEQRPYTHDWTLSQIERLCSASGTTIKDLICLPKSP